MFWGSILFRWYVFRIIFIKVICDSNKCGEKLLNDYQRVPDSAFSASSYFISQDKKADFSAKAAREGYDKEKEEFAWCPLNQVEKSLSEYLEINLGRLTMIKIVKTRGRFAQGSGKEFTPFFQIHYSRDNGSDWKKYKKFKDKGFENILHGPTDTFIEAFENLEPPIITKIIRIYPYSNTSRRVCLKLQLFGCQFTNDLLEYATRQGSPVVFKNGLFEEEPMKSGVLQMFCDNGYDGHKSNDLLSKGLGLLTDFVIGSALPTNDRKNYQFLGWQQNTYDSTQGIISIVFIFENQHNFTSMTIHSYAHQSFEIGYFHKLDITFIDNKVFRRVLEYENVDSEFNKTDHSINVSLKGEIGKTINVTLYYQTRWLLLSEISFISSPVESSTNLIPSIQSKPNKEYITSIIPFRVTASVIYRNSKFDISTLKPIEKPVSIEIIYLLTILLFLLLVIITAICSFWIIIRKRRSHRRRSIKKQALALCSQASFIPYNHNSKTVQCAPKSLPSLPVYPPSFTVDRRNYPNETLRNLSHLTGGYIPPSSSLDQNGFITKQSIADSNIYTSIVGSDNDSSLSPEYATTSITNDPSLQPSNFENSNSYLPPPIEPIRPQIFNDRSDCPSFYYPHPNTIPNIPDSSNVNFWRFNGQSIQNKGVNISSQLSFNDFSKDVLKADQPNFHNVSSVYSDLPRINSHY